MTISIKFIIHLVTLWSLIIIVQYVLFCYQTEAIDEASSEPSKPHETTLIYIITAIQCLILLPLPQIICNVLGLTFYNPFPGDIKIDKKLKLKVQEKRAITIIEHAKKNCSNGNDDCGQKHGDNLDKQLPPLSTTPLQPTEPALKQDPPSRISDLYPHLCFRVVTRGLYPELVRGNVYKNYTTCIESGLSNFSIEVVTDKEIFLDPMIDSNSNDLATTLAINAPASSKNVKGSIIREIVVPKAYETSTGALFKARALQYALEVGVSPIQNGDYIVHLDEETMLTRNSINGIVNFALSGEHAFGQGLITYSNLEIVNYFTTLADSYRVADDMGKLRFQLAALHKPIFGWKGSYVVTKYEAEVDVSFDHGPDGSIAEDCYFSMEANKKNYTFDFIQGEMHEKSPFTILDLVRQRKRWIQGIWLVVHSSKIPIKTKFFLAMSHYAWLALVVTTLSFVVGLVFTLPTPRWLQPLGSFCLPVTLYMYIFGLVKSFDLKDRPIHVLLAFLVGQILTLPLNLIVENLAVILGLTTSKYKFYIVKKELDKKVMPEA